MSDNSYRQGLSPLESLQQQATRLQSQTTSIFEGLTSELVGAGNALINSAASAASAITGFISGADAAFSNFITRITPNELLNKRSGLESLIPASKVISGAKSSLLGSDTLQFPLSPSDAKYKFRLSFREYVRPSALSPPKIERKGSIVLPVSPQMLDEHRINYDVDNTGLMGAIVNTFGGDNFEQAQQGIKQALQNGDFTQGLSAIKSQWGSIQNRTEAANAEDVIGGAKVGASALAKRYIVKKLSPEIYDLGTQVLGEILNPHPTVLFRGVGLKSYNFTFRLAPVSEKESKQLRKIINKLKEYSLPKYVNNTDKNMLKYPMMVYPEFIVEGTQGISKNGEKGALAKVYPMGFKYCVVKDITIDYAPTGQPAFFARGKGETAFIDLRMSFQEIEVQTSEDYQEGGAGAGGFDNVGSLLSSMGIGSDLPSNVAGGITTAVLPDITPAGTNVLDSAENRAKIEQAWNQP